MVSVAMPNVRQGANIFSVFRGGLLMMLLNSCIDHAYAEGMGKRAYMAIALLSRRGNTIRDDEAVDTKVSSSFFVPLPAGKKEDLKGISQGPQEKRQDATKAATIDADSHVLLEAPPNKTEMKYYMAGINMDEAIEYSTLYLRPQAKGYKFQYDKQDWYKINKVEEQYKYSSVISFYEDGTETYYLPAEEVKVVSELLTNDLMTKPEAVKGWTKLSQQIQELSRLVEVGPKIEGCSFQLLRQDQVTIDDEKATMDIQPLMEKWAGCYEEEMKLQREIYQYCISSESLDKAVDIFSTTLLNKLHEEYLAQHAMASKSDANKIARRAFSQLTRPKTKTMFATEKETFSELAQTVNEELNKLSAEQREAALRTVGRLTMNLEYSTLTQIRQHTLKYGHLEYHGWGPRAMMTHTDMLERLRKSVIKGVDVAKKHDQLQEKNNWIAPATLNILELHGQISLTKMVRRAAQLKAFARLDLLFELFAQGLQVRERTLRSLLPEQILDALRNKEQRTNIIEIAKTGGRDIYMGYRIENGKEEVLIGTAASDLEKLVKKNIVAYKETQLAANELGGHTVVVGHVEGIAVKITQENRHTITRMRSNEILVCEATDPDMIPLMETALAVLTQQGGATSHAAIVAKEVNNGLGVITITGIEKLLERVQDGMRLEVDADHGIVRILDQSNQVAVPASGVLESFGPKIYKLRQLQDRGFHVPPFFAARVPDSGLSDEVDFVPFIAQLNAIKPADPSKSFFAVRSCEVAEDLDGQSSAGAFNSLVNVKFDDVFQAVRTIAFENKGKMEQRNIQSAGRRTVIVQRMVYPAELAGVLFTNDNGWIRTEMSTKGADMVTDNKWDLGAKALRSLTNSSGRVDSFALDMEADNSLELVKEKFKKYEQHDDSINRFLRKLVKVGMDIESKFGGPQDIEWAWDGEELYIVQTRPKHQIDLELKSSLDLASARLNQAGVVAIPTDSIFCLGAAAASVGEMVPVFESAQRWDSTQNEDAPGICTSSDPKKVSYCQTIPSFAVCEEKNVKQCRCRRP
jgi:phosphohistidine swiveling domain-containing protein